MKMQWSVFEGEPYRARASVEARVTLSPQCVIYLNGPAYIALGAPHAVELMFEGNRRVIGMKPADIRKRNAFPVKRHSKGSYMRVSAAAFCHNFRIEPRETLLFDGADFDPDGVLLLDMNRTTTVGRGAR
ncbi:MAG: hypothetical protein WKF34_01315 [Pyrinomonadaceae bacterium]